MNNDIYTADYVSTLPPKIREDPELGALGEAIAEQLRLLAVKSKGCTLYSRIDELDEDLLDVLAYDFKVDWYSPDYTLEEKRAILKNSFKVHKSLGTKAAVETALGGIYNGAKVVERENEPYIFDIEIDATFQNIDSEKHEAVLDTVQYYKNLRSHLGVVQYATLPNGAATTFAGVGVGGLVMNISAEVNCYGME